MTVSLMQCRMVGGITAPVERKFNRRGERALWRKKSLAEEFTVEEEVVGLYKISTAPLTLSVKARNMKESTEERQKWAIKIRQMLMISGSQIL